MKEILALSDKSIHLKRNEFLKVAGSIDRNIYFLQSGSVKMCVSDEEEDRIVRFGYEGDLIFALDSYITGKQSALYIQAIKKCVLLAITRKQIDNFLNQKELRELWITTLERIAVEQLERELDLLTPSPKERYLRVLARSPKLFQEIPNKFIANYLRMSPETLSRLKKS